MAYWLDKEYFVTLNFEIQKQIYFLSWNGVLFA